MCFFMKDLENTQEVQKILRMASSDFEKRQDKTREKINRVSDEMKEWRYPQKPAMILSNKYR